MNNNTKELLKWIRETNINDVFPDKNVLGLGWGPKVKDGVETGEYSLIFTVDSKKPLSAIPTNELLPKTYQIQDSFYKTDVKEKVIYQKLNENSVSKFTKISVPIEIKNIESFDSIQPLNGNGTPSYTDCHNISNTVEPVKSNRMRRRELKSGCETIGGENWGRIVGTLGTFVIDKSDGQIVALSNNHVFTDSQLLANIKTNIVTNISNLSAYQPSGYWRTSIEEDFIGTAKRVVPIGNIDSTEIIGNIIADTSCDAAIVKLKSYDELINSNSLQPIGFEFAPPYPFATDEEIDSLLDSNSVNFGAPLFRSGRTCGPIGYPGNSQSCSLSAYEFDIALVGSYNGYHSLFSNSFLFRGNIVHGRGGDSGSMVLGLFDRGTPNEKWKIVGLLFAGPGMDFPTFSIGCRITNIARDLNLAPWDGTTIPTLSSNSTHVILDEINSNDYSTTVNLSGRVFYQLGRSNLIKIPKYNLYFSNGVEDTDDAYQFCQYTPITKLNEGISGFIELETNNVSDDISYTITGISEEYINIPLNGNFSNGYGRTQFTVSEDFLTEGTETIIVQLDGITPTVSAALIINSVQ
jgi:hypothetical protein